jgi:hypothetical protein
VRTPGWWRRRRERRSDAGSALLREFVYLDEVSVYSLLASHTGAIVSELTENQSSATTSEMTGSLRASVGVLRSDVRSKLEDTQTSATQVVRKSIVQASFKELFDARQDALVLRALGDAEHPGRLQQVADLVAAAEDDRWKAWVVDVDRMRRGDLLEMRVELEAAPIFRFGATLSSLIAIFRDSPEFLDLASRGGMTQGLAISRVLDSLLGGLVPVRGRAIEFRHVTAGGRSWVVHEGLLADLTASGGVTVLPLYVVGVAESRLFWKDIRRLLFSHASYTVMCRLGRDGASDSWTAVKLVDVVREFLPDIADGIGEMEDGLLSMMGTAQPSAAENIKDEAMATALVRYATRLAEHYGLSIDPADFELLAEGIVAAKDSHALPIDSTRAAFTAMTRGLREREDFPEDSLRAADLRAEALTASGLELDGTPMPSSGIATTPLPAKPVERYLDCEFVAIYW